jgi:hypothetical protein
MRKNVLLAVLAGTISAIAGAAPSGRANAITLAIPASVLNAVATIEQSEQVRWCGWRGCGYGYRGPRPYPLRYYGPWPYYGYYPAYGYYPIYRSWW